MHTSTSQFLLLLTFLSPKNTQTLHRHYTWDLTLTSLYFKFKSEYKLQRRDARGVWACFHLSTVDPEHKTKLKC